MENKALKWEIIKNEVINFSKDFSKVRASERKKYMILVEQKIKTLEKKLAMLNLGAENVVKVIERINTKLDYWKLESQKSTRYVVKGKILRSSVRWFEKGEKNTKYFLSLEKFKSKVKTMSVLQSGNKTLHTTADIINEQFKFYKELYSKDKDISF